MKTVDQKNKNQLVVNYVFTDYERELLEQRFLRIESNPYTNYKGFTQEIKNIVFNEESFQTISKNITSLGDRNWKEEPYLYLQNCPIDKDVPFFDHESPVESKRKLKKTYIAEAFLQFYAESLKMPAIGYINVNDGDVFQDIYPMKKLANSQSQKAMAQLGFHKDLANHFVRPDFVNMLSMRANEKNEIYTTFVKNTDLIKRLNADDIELMKQELFYTPFDDLSKFGNRSELGKAKNHTLLLNENEYDIAYFENRTLGLNDSAQELVEKIKNILHELKAPHLLKPGEFISLSNNHSIHGKDVGVISDEESQKVRWIIKTVNVWDLKEHKQYMLNDSDCIVNG